MDPLTTLATAIVAAVANLSETVVKDAYGAFKNLLMTKCGEADVKDAVEGLEAKPDSPGRRETLKEELEAVQAQDDPELVAAASSLLDKIKALPRGEEVVQNVRQTIVGNGNIVGGIGDLNIRLS